MVSKKSGRIAVPPDRYNVDAFYHPAGRSGSVCTRQGHFLQEEVASFDREFFAIPEHEAAMMDPQQRMLLEVVWECLENAGQTQWRGQEIGCFVGAFGENWLDLSSRDLQRPRENQVNTTMDFALANRVSYTFDLKGPRYISVYSFSVRKLD
jgi:acyl transferase domain-containing protein